MDEIKKCTAEEKRKKTTEYGEWIYLQKMKYFHERFKNEFEEQRDYFSNTALHDSYQEEHVAGVLHKKCTGQECLVDKRRKAETWRTTGEKLRLTAR
ncbi:MAG: hypothetical protein FWF13_00145 [Acidobacteria bacterium]|nr:hypothetical protein [Acidobacteriota bacterium]